MSTGSLGDLKIRSEGDSPWAPIVNAWRSKIKYARELKNEQFSKDALEAMKFYNGDHSFIWGDGPGSFGRGPSNSPGGDVPMFMMCYNIVSEVVQLFGPVLYHQNPTRLVNPRKPIEIPREVFVNPELEEQLQELQGQMQELQQQAQQAAPPMQPGMPSPMPMAPGQLQPGQPLPPPPMMAAMLQQLSQSLKQQAAEYDRLISRQQQRAGIDKCRATLMQTYLNYTPNELELDRHSRMAIDEALIKGMGILVTQLHQPPGSDFHMVGTFFETVDNLLIDPDVILRSDARWISLRCIEPVWQVEDLYGYKRGTLKANFESVAKQSEKDSDPFFHNYSKTRGRTNDLLVYEKVYSKMGIGARLSGLKNLGKRTKRAMELFGDHCYLAICDNADYPLNLGKIDFENIPESEFESALQAAEWPIPYWADNGWPHTEIVFHEVPGQLWPMSHIKPGVGELRFLDYTMSFLANKMRTASQDIIGVLKAAGDELKRQLVTGTQNGYTVIEIESQFGRDIREIISVIQMPPFNGDIWKVIAAVAERLDKRLGLTELAYGMSQRQYRSAAEANVKENQFSVRPDDMAKRVETSMSQVARKEAMAARWFLEPDDIRAQMGDDAAMLWERLVMSSEIEEVSREFEYRIEANSTKKPNFDKMASDMQQMMQTVMPVYAQRAAAGDVGPWNAVLRNYGKASGMDVSDMLLSPPPPGMNPEQQKLQAEQALLEMKVQVEQQMAATKQQTEAVRAQAEQQKAAMDAQIAEQEMAQRSAEHIQDMRITEEKAAVDLKVAKMRATAAKQKPSGSGK